MYNATITTPLEPRLVTSCFSQEEKSIQGRASYAIVTKNGKSTFTITAKDSTALRTALNSITKLLTVIEQTRQIT